MDQCSSQHATRSAVVLAAGDARQRITRLRVIRRDEDAETSTGSLQKTLSIQRFSADFLQQHLVPTMEEAIGRGNSSWFYEDVLTELISKNADEIHAVACHGSRWIEIDDLEDYRQAQVLFSSSASSPKSARRRRLAVVENKRNRR
ncbi:hypothetical protein QN219_23075 [Sinorhizobium sp. 7-81]|uniref:hypothetical protein n=1 Tax=Sinorhizobium sp. 8-89 TaxID=3049089 RepID=UPI0024C35D8E|nr:hypothetical protein [Sinorhizobium sp. 8-89]MDK1492908.1 hypothetical protein [Sinorhizobium sp. 8-89]